MISQILWLEPNIRHSVLVLLPLVRLLPQIACSSNLTLVALEPRQNVGREDRQSRILKSSQTTIT